MTHLLNLAAVYLGIIQRLLFMLGKTIMISILFTPESILVKTGCMMNQESHGVLYMLLSLIGAITLSIPSMKIPMVMANWNDVLIKMIPKFLHPKTETEFHLGILELIVSIDDSHAGLATEKTNAFFGDYWIPAEYKLIDNKAIITGFYDDSLAKLDDIRIGDIITKVDDKDVGAIFKEKEKYIPGSNISRKKYNAFNAIFNGSSDSVKIEFLRKTKIQSKTVKRYLLKNFNFKKKESDPYKILDGNIGYVNMGVLKIKDVPDVMGELNYYRLEAGRFSSDLSRLKVRQFRSSHLLSPHLES